MTPPKAAWLIMAALVAVVLVPAAPVLLRLDARAAAARQDYADARFLRTLGALARFDNAPLSEAQEVIYDDRNGVARPAVYLPLRRGGEPAGAAVRLVSEPGYNGPIELLVAIDAAGSVEAVVPLSHIETNGFGDAIEPANSDWLQAFRGATLAAGRSSDWQLRASGGRYDAISGATVTSRAVVGGVRAALEVAADAR
ncbi:MAG: RnfABCDGE type electron transport complex subunit G [Gammaproteobacteria bacterium]|nr:RnfABCDGE type electron transport complex subunit G [Gammaproteobacteria bacterium]NNM00401.1 RnfABCDGE type electron transport complex subunit G [Gammaproteobacteria bacterium]